MKRPWIIALGFTGLIVAVALLRYGTLSPCSAVKQRIKAAIVEEVAATESNSSIVIGMGMYALAAPMIDALVESQSPWQCARVLYRIETGTLDPESLFEPHAEAEQD